MSEDKSPGEAQQSFGAAPPPQPAAPAGQQSFGEAPPAGAAAPPPPPPPPVPAQASGEATFGEAPGQPTQTSGEVPPAPPAPPAPPTPEAKAPKKRGGVLRVLAGVAVGLLLLCLLGAFAVYRFINSDPLRNVGVGECLADVPNVAEGENRQIDSARTVECSDPAAAYRVEGRYDDKTVAESQTVCNAHPNAGYVITTADGDSRGYVLCLSQVE